ncbi:MAG: hypothetical protein R3F53_21670 [Gammaproteobacteria bacterium]
MQDGNFGLWIQDDQLENPNGLFVDGDQMIIGSWGKMTDGFSTEVLRSPEKCFTGRRFNPEPG